MRTVRQANAYLGQQVKSGPRFPVGWCKRKSREAYLIPSDGTGTASEAAEETRYRFRHQWVTGAFVWWGGGDGHVAICCYRKGWVWTTDNTREGHWNRRRIEDVDAWLGPRHPFLFASRDIDGMVPVKRPRIIRRFRYPA